MIIYAHLMNTEIILNYFEDEMALMALSINDFESIILIGSCAYPEFSRPDSDIDIIGIYNTQFGSASSFSKIVKRPDNNILEIRVMGGDDFRDYILTCDLPKLFAFIRGYVVLKGDGRDNTSDFIKIGISRYKTEAMRTASILKSQVFTDELLNARLYLTDSFSYINDPRVQRNNLLKTLREAEIIKDFIIHYWKLLLIEDLQKLQNIDIDVHEDLIREVGLFRVFNSIRGARIVDYEKYKVRIELQKIFTEIGSLLNSSIGDLKYYAETVFKRKYGVPLIVGPTESVDVTWNWV